jgi:hypothetical protein
MNGFELGYQNVWGRNREAISTPHIFGYWLRRNNPKAKRKSQNM